jgi:hypothetical protein
MHVSYTVDNGIRNPQNDLRPHRISFDIRLFDLDLKKNFQNLGKDISLERFSLLHKYSLKLEDNYEKIGVITALIITPILLVGVLLGSPAILGLIGMHIRIFESYRL